MLGPFFTLAARSPTRQRTLRRVAVAHVLLLAGSSFVATRASPAAARQVVGSLVLVAGIVEGAALVGWRLAQLPKSQALEFLLVSPLRPARALFAEALVGLTLLGLVTLAELPVLALLSAVGYLDPLDLVPLIVLPFTWGAVTGLGLTVWAYELVAVRRIGERVVVALIVSYLVVGVLAGENLARWVTGLPDGLRVAVLRGFVAVHTHNPFGVMKHWLENEPAVAWERVAGLQLAGVGLVAGLGLRACRRLQGHFHELHYQPHGTRAGVARPAVGERPLTWWAVKRVTKYSGRINLWLAGGFGVLYALYTVAGEQWPAWLGRRVFELADAAGGVPGLATGLVLLAAVPAAFQYGLWDATTQDRCRRLELLLLTRLGPRDFWAAAAAAAWNRGRGYFAVALLLWSAAWLAGRVGAAQVLTAAAGGVLLWGLYFALGFRAFSRGAQANGLGTLLTIGLPLAAYGCHRAGWPLLGELLPPGVVYRAALGPASAAWLLGPVLCAAAALAVARHSLARCDAQLRAWYDGNVGSKVMT